MTDRSVDGEDDVDRLLAETESMLRRLTDFVIGEGHHSATCPTSSETVQRLRDVLEHLRKALAAASSAGT